MKLSEYSFEYIVSRKGDNCHFLLHFLKGVYSKTKEFIPKGRKFFPVRIDSFSGRTWCTEKQT